jgi:hypothetical protein
VHIRPRAGNGLLGAHEVDNPVVGVVGALHGGRRPGRGRLGAQRPQLAPPPHADAAAGQQQRTDVHATTRRRMGSAITRWQQERHHRSSSGVLDGRQVSVAEYPVEARAAAAELC